MGVSTYLGNMVLDGFLRGQAVTLPSGLWASLHSADPANTGANEFAAAGWPAYVRKDILAGGALSAAFAAAASKATLSANQMIWPAYNGAGTITIAYFGIWDALTVGHFLFGGELLVDPSDPLSAANHKTLGVTDVFVINASQMGVKLF